MVNYVHFIVSIDKFILRWPFNKVSLLENMLPTLYEMRYQRWIVDWPTCCAARGTHGMLIMHACAVYQRYDLVYLMSYFSWPHLFYMWPNKSSCDICSWPVLLQHFLFLGFNGWQSRESLTSLHPRSFEDSFDPGYDFELFARKQCGKNQWWE